MTTTVLLVAAAGLIKTKHYSNFHDIYIPYILKLQWKLRGSGGAFCWWPGHLQGEQAWNIFQCQNIVHTVTRKPVIFQTCDIAKIIIKIQWHGKWGNVHGVKEGWWSAHLGKCVSATKLWSHFSLYIERHLLDQYLVQIYNLHFQFPTQACGWGSNLVGFHSLAFTSEFFNLMLQPLSRCWVLPPSSSSPPVATTTTSWGGRADVKIDFDMSC